MRKEDVDKLQRQKFTDLMGRITDSPLYQAKLERLNVREFTLDHITDLPITTKNELRDAGAFGNLAVNRREICQYHESFGTTGTPTSTWFTHEDLANGGRQMNQTGVRLSADDLVLVRFPYAISLPAHLMHQAAWQAGAAVVPASSRNFITPYPRVISLLQKLKVTVIAGLPREMELLAETARLMGMDPGQDFPHIRAICVAGELLVEKRRNHIQTLWNAAVYNMYGSTETANIAAMCEHGTMHITEEDFFIEVLKEDLSGTVTKGEKGMAVITSLTHKGSPLLRYLNEDIIMVSESNCLCGDGRKQMIHYGRGKDRFAVMGKVFDAKNIHDVIYSLLPVPDAWKVKVGTDSIHILLESHRSEQWNAAVLEEKIRNQLEVEITVEIVEHNTLMDRDELLYISSSAKPTYIEVNA